MALPNVKLAASLQVLSNLQRKGLNVIHSSELSRTHRERLMDNGYLHEAVAGWYLVTSPTTDRGDTTPWYSSAWEFLARYANNRFDQNWHLSPEQSLLLEAEVTTIPLQIMVSSPQASNNYLKLPSGSLFDLKTREMPPSADVKTRDGLRCLTKDAALISVSEAFFKNHPIEAKTILASYSDISPVLARLLDGGHAVIAGRIAGGFRHMAKPQLAEQIMTAMRSAGYDVRETNPFNSDTAPTIYMPSGQPAIVRRLGEMWNAQRQTVIDIFPAPPGLPVHTTSYLKSIDEIYRTDAYHSLSIEGYSVSDDLVERVRSGAWNPDSNEADRKSRDTMAARGYWGAFQAVKQSIVKIINGSNPGPIVRDNHRDWFVKMFEPSVQAGLLKPGTLAGYRNQPVFIRGSRHVPPRAEVVPEAIGAIWDLIEKEPHPAVRAILGHLYFAQVHPYIDGNGRSARFVMNAMLASGGYPWTVIRLEDRAQYMASLETAGTTLNVTDFTHVVGNAMVLSSGQYQQATLNVENTIDGDKSRITGGFDQT
jgi:hypothetical protein